MTQDAIHILTYTLSCSLRPASATSYYIYKLHTAERYSCSLLCTYVHYVLPYVSVQVVYRQDENTVSTIDNSHHRTTEHSTSTMLTNQSSGRVSETVDGVANISRNRSAYCTPYPAQPQGPGPRQARRGRAWGAGARAAQRRYTNTQRCRPKDRRTGPKNDSECTGGAWWYSCRSDIQYADVQRIQRNATVE